MKIKHKNAQIAGAKLVVVDGVEIEVDFDAIVTIEGGRVKISSSRPFAIPSSGPYGPLAPAPATPWQPATFPLYPGVTWNTSTNGSRCVFDDLPPGAWNITCSCPKHSAQRVGMIVAQPWAGEFGKMESLTAVQ